MDIQKVLYFLMLAETLNFTKTASYYKTSQSTVSRQIIDLEKDLGAKLFTRNNKEVILTEEGMLFLPCAKQIISAYRRAKQSIAELKDGSDGHLRIAYIPTAGGFLARCLSEFRKRYPGICVEAVSVTPLSTSPEAMQSSADFYFLTEDMANRLDGYEKTVVERDRIGLVVPKGHRLSRMQINFNEIKKENFMMFSRSALPGLYDKIKEFAASKDFYFYCTNTFDSVESLILAVGANLGITILPVSLPKTISPQLVDVVAIDGKGSEITHTAAWKNEKQTAAGSLFKEVIFDLCKF